MTTKTGRGLGRAMWLALMLAGAGARGEPVRYERIVRTEPVPLHIHVLRVDLRAPGVSLHVEVGEPPPEGVAGEVLIAEPRVLAERGNLDWAINTNPWHTPEDPRRFPMVPGEPAIITGWAVTGGVTRSETCVGCWEFWIDTEGRPRIGNVDKDEAQRPEVSLAVGGFVGLLRDGEVLPPAPGGARAPRSALGLDREGRILTMVVTDKGVPAGGEGWRDVMNTHELALLMQELGCWNAYNLDGGGSSILVRKTAGEAGAPVWLPVNAQSQWFQRALPMVLGVRLASPPAVP